MAAYDQVVVVVVGYPCNYYIYEVEFHRLASCNLGSHLPPHTHTHSVTHTLAGRAVAVNLIKSASTY